MWADAGIASWLSLVRPDDRVVTCAIARGEILFGVGRLPQGRRRNDLEAKALNLFATLQCEPIPPVTGDRYASVKLSQDSRPSARRCGYQTTRTG
jgi:hypothetical protein